MKRAVLNGAVLFYRKRYVMPLKVGKKNIGKNIKTEMAHGKKKDQAIAIALNVAGKSKPKAKKKAAVKVAAKKPSKLEMVMMAKVSSKKKKGGKC